MFYKYIKRDNQIVILLAIEKNELCIEILQNLQYKYIYNLLF